MCLWPSAQRILTCTALCPPPIPGLICSTYNCTINYYWVNLSPSFAAIGTTGDPILKQLYVINDLGMDGIARFAPASPSRRPYLRESVTTQAISYVLYGPVGTLPIPSLSSQIWFWVTPFTPGLWGVLTASLVFATVFMIVLESVVLGTEEDLKELQEKLGIEHLPRWRQHLSLVAHSLFAHGMSLTTIKDQEPVTMPGKIYTIGKSFTWWIVMASYLATLAAILANVPQPVQLLNTLGDFAATGSVMCMRSGTPASTLLPALYPAATVAVIAQNNVPSAGIVAGQPQVIAAPGATPATPAQLGNFGSTNPSDVADAINAGYCQGGVMLESDASYLLNDGDPTGKYCTLGTSGPPTESKVAFVFVLTSNVTQLPTAVVEALNMAIEGLQSNGKYYNQCQNVYLPSSRQPGGPCSAYLATQQIQSATATVKPLGVTDLSGLFAVQAIGAMAAILITLFQVFIKWEINHHHGRGCIGSGKGRKSSAKIPGEEEAEIEEGSEEREEKHEKKREERRPEQPPAPPLDVQGLVDEVFATAIASPQFVAAVRLAVYGEAPAPQRRRVRADEAAPAEAAM